MCAQPLMLLPNDSTSSPLRIDAAGGVEIPIDADHLSIIASVTAAAAEETTGGSAAFLLARPMPGRYSVAATAGPSPLQADEIVTLDDDHIVRDGLDFLSIRRPGQGAVRTGKRKVGPDRALAVPVTLCDRPVGEIVVFGAPAKGKEAAAAIVRLQALATSAAPAAAIGRAESFDTHLIELGAVVEVGQVLTGLLDMEDVLSYVVYLAESLVGGHCASVALVAEADGRIMIGNSTGALRAHEGESLLATEGLIGWVVTEGQSAIIASLPDDERGFSLGEGLGPGVVVPITSAGKVIGAFLVARLAGSRPFPKESEGMLQQMAAYAAIAITNAQTHRHQREVADTLRVQATELEQAYSELNRSQDQLLISEKMAALGRLTAGIAHEINSPLGGVMNAIMAVRNYVSEYQASIDDTDITGDDHRAIADDMLGALGTADAALSKVAQFVKSIKSQTRAGEGGSNVFDPAAEVDATIALIQHEAKRRRVGIFTEMERGHRLEGDQGKFGVVIQNLVSNALDAYSGEPGEVWVRMKSENGHLIVSVEDTGSGIPEEIRGRIFDYLFTTKDVGKGTGLGLAMVHSVITTNFNGKIDLKSAVGIGTTFTLTIPVSSEEEANHGA